MKKTSSGKYLENFGLVETQFRLRVTLLVEVNTLTHTQLETAELDDVRLVQVVPAIREVTHHHPQTLGRGLFSHAQKLFVLKLLQKWKVTVDGNTTKITNKNVSKC